MFNGLVSIPGSITSCQYGFLGDGDLGDLIVYGDSASNFSAVWFSGSSYIGAENGPSLNLDLDEYESCKGLLENAISLSGVLCTGL